MASTQTSPTLRANEPGSRSGTGNSHQMRRYIWADWYGDTTEEPSRELICLGRITEGFVVHVGNSGSTGDGDNQRCTERRPGDWVAYDGTPAE